MTSGDSAYFATQIQNKQAAVSTNSQTGSMDTFIDMGKQMGLTGKELVDWTTEQQRIQREDQAAKKEAEMEMERIRTEADKEKKKAEAEIERMRIDAELQKDMMRMEEEKSKRDDAAALDLD